MKLDTSDKVILISTGVILASAFMMNQNSKKYEAKFNEIEYMLDNVNNSIENAQTKIIENNRNVLEGNEMLKEIISIKLKEVSNE